MIDDYCDFRFEQLEWLKRDQPTHRLVGPVYSIEIKPKQGFITPESTQLGICKFRLRQQEKLSSQLIAKPSGYCPLDLFSGDESRMKFALSSLIANPQNNFRLFVDKEHVPEDELDEQLGQRSSGLNKEKLVHLLVSVLSHPFDLPEQGTSPLTAQSASLSDHQPCKYHFDIHQLSSKKPLNRGSVLKSILDVQRLDEIGSSKASELYNSLKAK